MLKAEIHGNEIELTEAIMAAIEGKLASLDKYLAATGTPQELRVEVGRTTHHHHKGELFTAKANLKIPGGLIRVEETADELYRAIDRLKDRLKHEIDKAAKTKLEEKRSGARIAKEQGTETELL